MDSNIAVLILAYKRGEELQKVIDSVQQLNPKTIYFHIHDSQDEDGNFDVDSAKSVIKAYKGEKKVLYVKEYLGCTKAMYSALKWVSELESKFYVFEDDVVLSEIDKSFTDKYESLESGIFKFGELADNTCHWGWAVTSDVVKEILEFDVERLQPDLLDVQIDALAFVAWKELARRGYAMAWDENVHLIAKINKTNVVLADKVYTSHIGVKTTRDSAPKGEKRYVTYRNGKLVN